MRMRHRVILSTVITMIALPVLAAGQSLPYPTDAQTGRAVGANDPPELKKQLDTGEKVLLIDVREGRCTRKRRSPALSIFRSPEGPEGHPQGPDTRVHVRDGEAELAGCEAGRGPRLQDGRFLRSELEGAGLPTEPGKR